MKETTEELMEEIMEEAMNEEEEIEIQEAQAIQDIYLKDIGEFSDGNYTMNELYNHRMMLFSVICNLFKDSAWKAWKDCDGNGVENMFMAGITTPKGEFVYRFSDECWKFFKIPEFEKAPKYSSTDDFSILTSLIETD